MAPAGNVWSSWTCSCRCFGSRTDQKTGHPLAPGANYPANEARRKCVETFQNNTAFPTAYKQRSTRFTTCSRAWMAFFERPTLGRNQGNQKPGWTVSYSPNAPDSMQVSIGKRELQNHLVEFNL